MAKIIKDSKVKVEFSEIGGFSALSGVTAGRPAVIAIVSGRCSDPCWDVMG